MTLINSKNPITLEAATQKDCKLLFAWRNLPEIVKLGTENRTVDFDEHEQWFDHALASDRCKIFILIHNGTPIGQIRFDFNDKSEATISIYIIKPYTGRGLGKIAIDQACNLIFKSRLELQLINAYVKVDNTSSIRVFERVGFLSNLLSHKKHNHVCLTLHR